MSAMNVHSLEWFDLRKYAEIKLKRSEFGQVASADWDNLLMRFRKLREALTAAAAPADLRCQVYELSADVCAAADNMAELLKCLQQLVNNIYPALWCVQQQQQQQQLMQESTERACQQHQRQQHHQQQQQQQQQEDRQQLQHGHAQQPPRVVQEQPQRDHHTASQQACCGAAASRSSPAHTITATSSSSSSKHSQQQRYAEVASALLLYFACVPRRPVIQEINKQLRAAARPKPYCQGLALIADLVYHRAVLDTVAALRCDWCAFLSSFNSDSQPPPLVRAVMRQHVERLRVEAVCRVGVAYRMLPTSVLQRWLWLQQGDTSCSSDGSSSCNTVAGSNSSQQGATGSPAAAAGPSTVPYQQLVALLQQAAANSGSRAAVVAAAQCTELGSLPLTLQFRAQST